MEQIHSTYETEVKFSFDNPFLRSIEAHSQECRVYKLIHLLLSARAVIPLDTLKIEANKQLAQLQALNQIENPDKLKKEMILRRLLIWFKTSFFTWVDNPKCRYCKMKTTFSHMSNDKRFINTDLVEMHKCDVCKEYTPFPRYNKLDILLMMRKGRSVESAKLFTLMCYALGWDARYIVDEGNHVWSEVFCESQNRWLHCDPSENSIDTPLMYEHGWNKKITYVMAYSIDDIEDVTRRYTSNFKEVLTRRKNCNEIELMEAITKLRGDIQKEVLSERKNELLMRSMFELKEFTVEKQPSDEERKGRTYGTGFRSMREEYDVINPFVWEISDITTKENVTIRYSTSQNIYQYLVDGLMKYEVHGWFNGVYLSKNIIRHEETDLKQVYLCSSKDGIKIAEIMWLFNVSIPGKIIDEVVITFNENKFHNGRISAFISESDIYLPITDGIQTFVVFGEKINLTIGALMWGEGETSAGQHVQLFKQSTKATDFPFIVEFTFKDGHEEN